MVSIIIPVYNVYECIDRCMETVVGQTYKNIEIILINDGSTDGSELKCKKDCRINYISKSNEGLGPTRNLGVKVAKSDYIMFVDSDDWIDVTMVEKLFEKLKETDSDMAVCDRYDVKCNEDSYTLVIQDLEDVMNISEYPQIISNISTSQWGKIYKKSLFTVNQIEQPKHLYEDAITPVLAALSDRICYVREPLYYYVVDRGKSITNSIVGLDSLVEYLKTAVKLFKKHDLFEKYNKEIFEMCRKRADWNMYHSEKVLTQKLTDLRVINEKFLIENWKDKGYNSVKYLQELENQFYIWGSYNLMTAMKMLMKTYTPKVPEKHYCFSSIISAMDNDKGTMNDIDVEHSNKFRKYHLIREFQRDFANKNKGEMSDINYLIIDFMEERYDIGEYRGKYFTISDSFEEMKNSENIIYTRYMRNLEEVREMWEHACLNFIKKIRRYFEDKTIVIVKMKLAEEFGDFEIREKYPNIAEIHKINDMLEEYYSFFIQNCPEAIVIEVADSEWYFTDKNFRHGCHEWHLNEYMYREIMKRIEDKIWKYTNESGFFLEQEMREKN